MRALPGFSRAGRLVTAFRDNAMFYKDITQWMRNRTFGALFFGLLLVAEILTGFVIFASDDIANPGPVLFYGLYLTLVIYALLIAFQGNTLTNKEFGNRTFELFELSGMSLERMVSGKFLSMYYQFLFGFFCLVPFMFFSYIVGGLDFVEMALGVLLAVLLTVPLYLFSLAAALTSRFKQAGTVVKVIALFMVLPFVVSLLISVFSGHFLFQEIIKEFARVVNGAFGKDPIYLIVLLGIVFSYVQVCLLLFYLCCDNISRENDSREMAVKLLSFSLMLTWIAFVTLPSTMNPGGEIPEGLAAVPVFISILLLGMRAFYAPVAMPLIVRRRYERSRNPLTKLLFPIFKPGIQGGVISIIVISITTAALLAASIGNWDSATALLIQPAWFLVFPFIFFVNFKDVRQNYSLQRTLSLLAWVILGMLVLLVGAFAGGNYAARQSEGRMAMNVLLSPISSFPVMLSSGSSTLVAQPLFTFSGLVGMIIMWSHMRSAVRSARLEEQNAASASLQSSQHPNGPSAGTLAAPVTPDGTDALASEVPSADNSESL